MSMADLCAAMSNPPTPSLLPTFFAPAERVDAGQIRRQAAAVAASPLVSTLLNSMLDVALILNARRQIVFASENTLSLLPSGDLSAALGKRPGEALACIQASTGPGGCGTAAACCECGAVHAILSGLSGKGATQECRITRIVGGRRESLDLRVRSTPFMHEGEQYTILSVADISHEKRRRALEDTFLRDLSDQTGCIEGQAMLVRSQLPDGQLRDEVDDMMQMIGELSEKVLARCDLAAAENDRLIPVFATLRARDFIKTLARHFALHVLGAGCWLRIDPASANPAFLSDRGLLQRVLGNLLRNALEAAQPGEAITLGCDSEDDVVNFRIQNASIMPRKVCLQIFNRSFSTKSPGRGLGTYSARLLVERYLHGRIRFTSGGTTGTTFIVTLPLNPLAPQ